MIIIASMGGCGSTEFIDWASRHIDCNCSMNSEGLPQPGPGSNWKGLKHRSSPPAPDDSYLPAGKKIERSLFLFDSPYQIIPSLFRRNIAVGHAIAITGTRPVHGNDLDQFLELGFDSFDFAGQFASWSDTSIALPYPRMLLRSSCVWSHIPELLAFLGIPTRAAASFPPKRQRQSSFDGLSAMQKEKMRIIYSALDRRIVASPEIQLI